MVERSLPNILSVFLYADPEANGLFGARLRKLSRGLELLSQGELLISIQSCYHSVVLGKLQRIMGIWQGG